jgi:MFS family permease
MVLLLPLCLANFAVLFMVSGVGVALPAIQHDLGGSAVLLGWMEGAYTLALAMAFVPVARLVDVWGYRRMFRIALAVFLTAGILLAFSPNLPFAIAVRTLQAVAGATINTAALSILAVGADGQRRGSAMGWFVASIYAGLAVGPLVGGIVVHHLGWRSVFVLSVPVVAVAWFFSGRMRGEWRPRQGQGIDVLGCVLYAGSVETWLMALASVGNAYRVGQLVASAVLLTWWFVRRMGHQVDPLLDIRAVAQNRALVFSLLATGINYASTFCVGFLLSLYLQVVRGLSPTHAGLVLAVPPFIQSLGSPGVGRLADRLPAPWMASAGMGLCAGVLAVLASNAQGFSVLQLAGVLAVLGLGFALFASPNMTVILAAVPPQSYAVASSLTGAMRTFGMAASMAGITVVFGQVMGERAVHEAGPGPLSEAVVTVLGGAATLSLVGIVLSLGRVAWPDWKR